MKFEYAVIRALFYKLKFRKLGFPSKIGKPLKVMKARNVYCGKRVRIMSGFRIECHNKGTIRIGDDVSIGQNLHLVSGGDLTIGSHVTLSGNVFVSNLVHSYEKINVSALKQPHIIKPVTIGDYCFIGYGACILPGTELGKNVIVGANSVVSGKFPDYVVVAGVPAKIIKKYN
ncbi:MAG: acyltransferase, partial [Bacilli bacterium]|nr:acyltransferase [Bacilli bacterium]